MEAIAFNDALLVRVLSENRPENFLVRKDIRAIIDV
jgi:hypothetical protein